MSVAPPRTLPLLPVLLCFLLSGFAALIYETVWTRQFALVFGTSELAVATVLAAYMAGLAAGAAAIGRYVRVVRRPLLAYGLLELGIALSALVVPLAIRSSTGLSVALFGGRGTPPEGEWPLAVFYLVCSFAILLVPTGLMGATLPLLARFVVRDEHDIGRRVGILYATNTVGAVAGTLVAGFVMLPSLGLRDTVLAAAAVNGIVFAVATALARGGPPSRVEAAPAESAPPAPGPGGRGLILPLVLASGVASFMYEVLWTRLLGHVLGGSIYAFATMLASFLTGIALGSGVAARLASSPAAAARGFGVAQLGVAVLSWLAFSVLDFLPALAARVGAGGAAGLVHNAAVAAAVLLPSTISIGATFPFAVRTLASRGGEAAAASARVYAWNTVGAILGAVGSGFWLIPLLGYVGTMTAAIAMNLLLAGAAGFLIAGRGRAVALAAAIGLAALAVRPPAMPWRLVGTMALAPGVSIPQPIYFAVGRSATVSITEEYGMWRLRTNGLPDGTIVPAGRNLQSVLERWLGALPCLARPGIRSMLVIGLGAGSALEAIPRTVERIDVIELEPTVIEANRFLEGRRAVDPLADPRVHLFTNDARGALVLSNTRYDAVVSQPSHPWTAGAAHLYTREFFALVRDHLAPGGVFVQWIELDLVDAALLRSLAGTLQAVFPSVRVYRPVSRIGVLFLASDQPLSVESVAAEAIAASPKEFQWASVQTPEDVAAALAVDEEGVRRLAAGAALTTDDLNLLETRSPRILGAPLGSDGADHLLAPLDPLPRLSQQLRGVYLVRRLIADQNLRRALRLASTMGDEQERLVAGGLATLAAGATGDGIKMLREALRRDPSDEEARFALVRAKREALLTGAPDARELAAPLADPAASVIEGWRAETAGDWSGLRALETRLASAGPYDPAYPDALLLRARWRVESGEAARAAEALVLLDQMLPISADPGARQLRERAVNAAGTIAADAVARPGHLIAGSTPR